MITLKQIKLVIQYNIQCIKFKMIIKVSHCSSGKIMISGHNAGSTERQGEGEGEGEAC